VSWPAAAIPTDQAKTLIAFKFGPNHPIILSELVAALGGGPPIRSASQRGGLASRARYRYDDYPANLGNCRHYGQWLP
jgi:hypothetical protein